MKCAPAGLCFPFVLSLLLTCSDKGDASECRHHSQDPPGYIPEGTEQAKDEGALARVELFPPP